MPNVLMADFIRWVAELVGTDLFVVRAVLTLLVMCLVCGMVGGLVVGNRMAFFSDTMAHCAFAGVALGYLSVLFSQSDRAVATWLVPLVMVGFGVAVGIAMV